jgi:hypothetical protein
MTYLPLKSVRYNRVFVNNRVRYNRVSLYVFIYWPTAYPSSERRKSSFPVQFPRSGFSSPDSSFESISSSSVFSFLEPLAWNRGGKNYSIKSSLILSTKFWFFRRSFDFVDENSILSTKIRFWLQLNQWHIKASVLVFFASSCYFNSWPQTDDV